MSLKGIGVIIGMFLLLVSVALSVVMSNIWRGSLANEIGDTLDVYYANGNFYGSVPVEERDSIDGTPVARREGSKLILEFRVIEGGVPRTTKRHYTSAIYHNGQDRKISLLEVHQIHFEVRHGASDVKTVDPVVFVKEY